MLLQYYNGEPFATGATNYEYRPATEHDTTPRIVVSIKIDHTLQTLAFVDTGGVYVLCSPEIADELALDPQEGYPERIQWRSQSIDGYLYRIPMTLIAEDGASLEFEPTYFIPALKPDQIWPIEFQCVLGMHSCLERLRFAVDPDDENPTFYFGER